MRTFTKGLSTLQELCVISICTYMRPANGLSRDRLFLLSSLVHVPIFSHFSRGEGGQGAIFRAQGRTDGREKVRIPALARLDSAHYIL